MAMNIEIWGTYPPPIGGVSIHILRLIHSLHELNDAIILKNFGKSKSNYGYIIRVKFRLWEFIRLLFVKQRIIHTHSNNIFSFLLFYIFGFRHKIGLTIHNKNFIEEKDIIKKLIIKNILRISQFIIMNDPEYKILLRNAFNLDENKIFINPAFIPPLPMEWIGLDKSILEFRKKHSFLISANAFKLRLYKSIDVYGLDMLIDLINRLKYQNTDVGLIFCLPIIGDKSYYDKCREVINNLNLSENIMIFQSEISNGFEIWKVSDLFIRPTYTDIEGISVKEALYCDTPVIASDVCIRPDEVILFKNRDKDDLFEKVSDFYTNRYKYKSQKKLDDSVDNLLKIYRSLG